jgi:hypothetical protein
MTKFKVTRTWTIEDDDVENETDASLYVDTNFNQDEDYEEDVEEIE